MAAKQTKGERTKQLIADEARHLFSKKGYLATSIEDIVSVTGISKGSLYYHFKNKESMFLHIIEENHYQWKAEWQTLAAGYKTVTEKLYGIAAHLVKTYENPLKHAAEEFSRLEKDEEMLEKIFAILRDTRSIYEELIEEGIQNGELKRMDPQKMSYIFSSLLDGLGYVYFEIQSPEEFRNLHRAAVEVFLNGAANK